MKILVFVSLLLVAAFNPPELAAQYPGPRSPDSLSIQGLVTDETGTPINAAVPMTFKIYKSGSEVWSNTYDSVDVDDGVFSVSLAGNRIDTVAFVGPMELGIAVGADAEMTPRMPLASVAFARAIPGMYSWYAEDFNWRGVNIVGGAPNNRINFPNTTVGSTISGGGGLNSVGNSTANTITGDFSTIGGGHGNTIESFDAVISGGINNTVTTHQSVIGGGFGNLADGIASTVGGGHNNTASGDYSTVPGGSHSAAEGAYSFAAGLKARAEHPGTFVWADSQYFYDPEFASTDPNQFLIRARGGVGIGTNNPANQFHVARSVSGSASVQNHVAVIDNTSTGSGADVLALRVGTSEFPQTTNAFITFKYAGNQSAGFIRGNNNGGVELISSSADFAEYLPKINPIEKLDPGDVVGVFSGRVTRATDGADQVMVVSTAPIVTGNSQQLDNEDDTSYAKIAFVGQVPVRVRGPVKAGDLLIPSGLGDGTAVAVAPIALSPSVLRSVLGTSWESNADPDVKKVNAGIGIDRLSAASWAIQALRDSNLERDRQIAALEERLSILERRLTN